MSNNPIEPETLTADPALGAPLVDDLPEVQQHAIDEARADRDAVQAHDGDSAVQDAGSKPSADAQRINSTRSDAGAGVKSPSGEDYDTRVHEDPPRVNAKGGWARRRGGARRGGAAGPIEGSTVGAPKPRAKVAGPDPVAEEAAKRAADAARLASLQETYKHNGEMAAGAFFGLGQALVGDCFTPDKGEETSLSNAASAWMAEANITAPPSWVVLLIVTGSIVGKRWNHPQFIARRRELVEKVNALRGIPEPAPTVPLTAPVTPVIPVKVTAKVRQ